MMTNRDETSLASMHSSEQSSLVKYWLVFRRRWFPASLTFLTVLALSIFHVLSKEPIYQAQGILSFPIDDSTSRLIGLETSSQAAVSALLDARTLEREMITMQSTPVLEKVVAAIGPEPGQQRLGIGMIRQGLHVQQMGKTTALQVSFKTGDPKTAERVVNQLMGIYVKENLHANKETTAKASEFISSQLPKVKQRVYETESELRRFKEVYKIADLETFKSGISTQLAAAQEGLSGSDTQLKELEARFTALKSKLRMSPQEASAVSALSQAEDVQVLRSELDTLESQIVASGLTEEHPHIITRRDRQRELRKLLGERVKRVLNEQGFSSAPRLRADEKQVEFLNSLIQADIDRQSLLARQTALRQQKSQYQQQASLLPKLEQRFRELQRELTAAESTYQSLLKSLQDLRVTENQTIANVKVIEPARVPVVPIAPNKIAEIFRGALLGVFLAGGVAYLLEVCDRKLKSTDTIRDFYPYTLLGNIPRFDEGPLEGSHLPTLYDPRSPISESYGMLQANLKFLSSDNPLRILAITSALPKEGKSTTCANLGVALSQVGQRVLIIDADLRRPSQHQIWEVSNDKGLSNVLAEPELQDDHALPVHHVVDNLDVLSAGVIPPNPLGLLDSKRMNELIHAQAEYYDYVLLDAPPITAAADPLILGKLADGLLLVARPEVLDKDSAKMGKDTLLQSGLNVLGIVINGVIPKNESYSYYYYSSYSRSYYNSPNLESSTNTKRSWQKDKRTKRPMPEDSASLLKEET